MKILRQLAIGAASIFGLVVAVGVFLPSTVRVERQIEIGAPAATLFALANDFHRINQWSPWVESDPNARYEITGPRRGAGATLTWDGPIVGSGSQVIVESEPFSRVVSELDLGGQSKARATLEIVETDWGGRVAWSFDNDFGMNIFGRYFGLMLDGIVGADFEQGLRNLKAMAESLPPANFAEIEIERRTVESADIALLPTRSMPESAAVSAALGDAYFELLNFIDRHRLEEAGAPLSIGGRFDGSVLQFDAAIPVRGITEDTPRKDGEIRLAKSYAGRVIRVKHTGSYRTLSETHEKIAAYLAALGIRRNGESWESYVTDPTRVAESEMLTYVYYPIEADH